MFFLTPRRCWSFPLLPKRQGKEEYRRVFDCMVIRGQSTNAIKDRCGVLCNVFNSCSSSYFCWLRFFLFESPHRFCFFFIMSYITPSELSSSFRDKVILIDVVRAYILSLGVVCILFFCLLSLKQKRQRMLLRWVCHDTIERFSLWRKVYWPSPSRHFPPSEYLCGLV